MICVCEHEAVATLHCANSPEINKLQIFKYNSTVTKNLEIFQTVTYLKNSHYGAK